MKSQGKLDYIHSDLWGPASVQTHGGARYFLTLIHNFSRKTWVFMLKTKDETFMKFVEWKNLVENSAGRKIKTIKTDDGIEFLNENFRKL